MIHVNTCNRLTASFLHILATSSPVLSLNRNLSIKINSNSHWDSEITVHVLQGFIGTFTYYSGPGKDAQQLRSMAPQLITKFLNLMGPWQYILRPFLKCIIVYFCCYKQHLVKSDEKDWSICLFSSFVHPTRWDKYLWVMFHVDTLMANRQVN